MTISIQELAEKIGMSPSAISRTLSGDPRKRALVNEEKRRYIEEAARRHNYAPNPVAGNLRQQRSGQIGIAMNMNLAGGNEVTTIGDLNFIIMRSFLEAARKYQVATWFQGFSNEDSKEVLELYRRQRLDGIVVSHREDPEYLKQLIRYRDEGGRVVMIDNLDHKWPFPRVSPDHFKAGYLAGEYLIRRGCRKTGYYGCDYHWGCSEERFAGFVHALRDHGLEFDSRYLLRDNGKSLEYGLPDRREIPDGFFTWNDIAAIKLIRRLRAMNLDIPVIGCDNRPLNRFMEFRFPSIDCHYEKMGNYALELLLGDAREQHTRLIEPELKDV